jgi:arginine decarboxylase
MLPNCTASIIKARTIFTINKAGDMVVTLFGRSNGPGISLYTIAREVGEREMSMLALLRVGDISGSHIKLLHETFRKVIRETSYSGEYKGV